jgi:hypothetical protein
VEPVAHLTPVSYPLSLAEVSMSYARFAPLKLTLLRALLIAALPTACAVGVKPDLEDTGGTGQTGDTAGTSAGGMLTTTAGSGSVLPHSGTTSTGGSAVSSPFGGTSSSGSGGAAPGGASNGGSGGSGGSGGAAGAGGKASGGAAGAGGSGGGAGGSGSGCACPKTVMWADNMVLGFVTGNCLDVKGQLYLYTGTKAQTYANGDCNPAKQLSWCTDMGNDYKFMLCK